MKKRIGTDQLCFNIIGGTLLAVFGLCCVLPFVLMVTSSFASQQSLMVNGYSLFPSELSLNAYRYIFQNPMRILRAYGNTIVLTGIGTVLSTMITVMGGYVLSRPDFKWRNVFSFFFFFTTLFSGGLVPWYILCTRYLGFKNSYLALLIPPLFSVWNLIIAKNYLKSIPFEITESAKVDGANDLTIFFRLILPIIKPLLATIGMFTALTYWNDWYNALLFITDKDKQPLQAFLQDMLQSADAIKQMGTQISGSSSLSSTPTESMKMAMTCVATGPIILLYPFVQRFFVKGLTIGSVKG